MPTIASDHVSRVNDFRLLTAEFRACVVTRFLATIKDVYQVEGQRVKVCRAFPTSAQPTVANRSMTVPDCRRLFLAASDTTSSQWLTNR
jgi:hypothetical protein